MTDPRIEAAARALCERQGYPSGGSELAASCGFSENWEAFEDDAQAAITAADATAWSPIETAPKDAEMILLGYLDVSGKFSARTAEWALVHPRSSDKEWAYAWVCKMSDRLVDQRATHWQPLPKPPTPRE